MDKPLYSDINYRPRVTPVEVLYDGAAINQNIAMIFDTPKKTKWFRPHIGSNINALLFEPLDDVTADQLKYSMSTALSTNGEYRVQFTDVVVMPDIINQQYYCEVHYEAPELSLRKQVFKFNLSRGV